jgi:hypothetical protein
MRWPRGQARILNNIPVCEGGADSDNNDHDDDYERALPGIYHPDPPRASNG